MFMLVETQLARIRHEEMIQAAERERRLAEMPTVQINLFENAFKAFKTAFVRRNQSVQPKRVPIRPAVAAE